MSFENDFVKFKFDKNTLYAKVVAKKIITCIMILNLMIF